MSYVNNPSPGKAEKSLDLLESTTVIPAVGAGAVVADILITPSIVPRLKTLAAAWQRIKYQRLKFIIAATGSSLTSGEFVFAFLPDPTDVVPTSNAAQWVRAQGKSGNSAYWETREIHAPVPPQILYTSFDADEPRQSSPGRLVIVSLSPPSSDAPISVSLEWEVIFSQPSLEQSLEGPADVYTLQDYSRLLLSDGGASQEFDPYLRFAPFEDTDYLTPTHFEPALPSGVYLSLAAPKTLNSDTGASGAPENAIVTHLADSVAHPGRISYYYIDENDFIELAAAKPFSIRPTSDALLSEGDFFEADLRSPAFVDGALGFRAQRTRRELRSVVVLTKLPSGKIVSSCCSKKSGIRSRV